MFWGRLWGASEIIADTTLIDEFKGLDKLKIFSLLVNEYKKDPMRMKTLAKIYNLPDFANDKDVKDLEKMVIN